MFRRALRFALSLEGLVIVVIFALLAALAHAARH